MNKYFILTSWAAKILAVILLIEIGFTVGLFYYFSTFNYQFVDHRFQKPDTNKTKDIISKSYLEDVFAKTIWPPKLVGAKISGIIVNHHLLADKLIARGLSLDATDSAITIVLLSPNHFGRGYGPITVAAKDWLTPVGYLAADRNLISALAGTKTVIIDDRPFELEHGITNILPFIKKLYPRARIVPIIINEGLSDQHGDELVKSLLSFLPQNSLIVASLDFSHYRTSELADFFDRQTQNIIDNNDFKKVASLNKNNQPDNVDSAPTLRIMLELMSRYGSKFFTLDHTNADKLTGNLASRDNTSYIVGAFYQK